MGLCLSVALWKENANGRRAAARARRGHAGVGDATTGDVSDYGLIGGGGELEAEEAAAPRAAGVGVAGGGTPVRPIWQRRVLMGVKCQLPRFSGMILYDERGRPVCGGVRDRARDQEKHAAAITVLREMLYSSPVTGEFATLSG